MSNFMVTVQAFNDAEEKIILDSVCFENELWEFLIKQIKTLDLTSDQLSDFLELENSYFQSISDLESFWKKIDSRTLWSIVKTDIPGIEDFILDDLEYLIGMAKKMEESEDCEKAVPIFVENIWGNHYLGNWDEFKQKFLGIYPTKNDYVAELIQEKGLVSALKSVNSSANIHWFDLDYVGSHYQDEFSAYEVEGGVCIFSN